MVIVLSIGVLLLQVLNCDCQSSTLTLSVVEKTQRDNYTFVCSVSSATKGTTWIRLPGNSGATNMIHEDGTCKTSPDTSVLKNKFKYTTSCTKTVYNVTLHAYNGSTNDILICRDTLQPERIISGWITKFIDDNAGCIFCDQTILFDVQKIIERDNVTFTCIVSSDVPYVNWNKNIGSNTSSMGVQNGKCNTSSGISFLDDTSKYVYTCNSTVYQVTIINVSRSEHNDMYMCTPPAQQEGTGSNWIINVKAPVTSVTLTPANYLINIKENIPVKFNCTTSTARPAASAYWYRHPNSNSYDETQIAENITTTTDYNDLKVTTSILRFVPTRQDNGTKIFCKANNAVNTGPVSTNKKLLNVLYKAKDPFIAQGKEYRVIENNAVTLSCSVKGGNPTPTLSWSCNNFSPMNRQTFNSNGNFTTTLTWRPLRANAGTCTCKAHQTGFQDTTADVTLVVLYPPSKPTFRTGGSNAEGDVSFIEGNTRTIRCTSVSKPLPDRYIWTGPKIVDSINLQSVTLSNIRQIDAGEYKCTVHNTMNPSNGELIAGINSRTVNVDVLYPPSALYFVYGNQTGHNISNKSIDVIEGHSFKIVCKSIDGNPLPTCRWNGQNDNVSVLTVDNIREARTNATCIATNNMRETNKPVVQGNTSDIMRFNVLIRPTIKSCRLHYTNRRASGINLTDDNTNQLMLIEKESFILECSTEGKPTPTAWWNIPQMSLVSSSLVTVNNLTRHMKGDYVFKAHALLEPSFKGKQNVTVNKTVSVQVLYPPEVLSRNNISKLKGDRLNLICNYTAGVPKMTLIKWTRSIDNKEWNEAIINIDTLKKNDTGVYTCTASNTMIQSGDSTSYIGQHNQSFHLDVQYAASITSFTIDGLPTQTVTVNEKEPVKFKCNADSNPPAVMTMIHESKTLKNVTSNNVEYNIANASCLDAATYYCFAQNLHNGENKVSDKVQLFVNCYPRVGEDNDVNVTSEKNNTVTLVFNVIAYPAPAFTWYQFVDGNLTIIRGDDNYDIVSTNLKSILTIHHVGIKDFTSYKINVKNEFGQMEKIYTLSPYDKPDPPKRLKHIEGRTTTSSIHIEWEPGFDNGPSQTFHIKYKKSSDSVWNYLNVSDNGQPTMNITLTGLLDNTQYDVIIFASNVKGNSSESDVLITRTKAIPNSPSIPGALIGGIAGGVTGCIVIFIVIVFIIRRYPLFKENGADEQNVRRSVSEDSDDEDGLVDNPMYASSSNVAPVASTSASTSSDIYTKPVKPNKTNAAGNGDIYSVVNKTMGQGKGGKGKSTNEKGKQKEGDVYENVELENDPNKKDVGKQLPPKPAAEQPKLKIVNQDGLIYADLVFKDKPPGEKMVILGDDPTPYDLVDFTKKADPLPESDEEEHK